MSRNMTPFPDQYDYRQITGSETINEKLQTHNSDIQPEQGQSSDRYRRPPSS